MDNLVEVFALEDFVVELLDERFLGEVTQHEKIVRAGTTDWVDVHC